MLKSKNLSKISVISIALPLALVLLTGCGKTAVSVGTTSELEAAPGTLNIPPKVDILLAQSDVGGIMESYNTVTAEAKAFLTNLNSKNWDFRFATIPLTTLRPVTQVVGSSYDSNSVPWTPAYPGISASDPGMLLASVFRTVANYSDFLPASFAVTKLGNEPGFENIRQTLLDPTTVKNFLRSDATTVILVLSNTEDTSLVNYCIQGATGGGQTVPCGNLGSGPGPISAYRPGTPIWQSGGTLPLDTQVSSMAYYQDFFKNYNRGNVQFYSAVASAKTTQCMLRSSSFVGYRYQKMASAVNGASYDICTQDISQIFSNLTASLTAQQVNYRENYIFLKQAPNPDSIVVTRYVGGDKSQAQVIPKDANNGWSYVGAVSNVYAISGVLPNGTQVNLNLTSSPYAIKLTGSLATVNGNDTTSVEFTPAGAQNAVSK